MSARLRRGVVTAALVALAMLAGCSKSEPENVTTVANEATDMPPPEAPPPVETPPPAPPPLPAPVRIETPPEPEIAPDAQIQDDADATGMTARVTRDGASASDATGSEMAANAAAPE